MKKKNIIIMLIGVLSLLLTIACPPAGGDNNITTTTSAGSSDSAKTKILPAKFMSNIPDSLKDSTQKGVTQSRTYGMGSSFGHSMIKSTIKEIDSYVKDIAYQFAIIDEVIKDLSTSSSEVKDKEITITKDFVDKMKSVTPDDYDDIIGVNYNAMIGQTLTVPAFIYNVSDDKDFNKMFANNFSGEYFGVGYSYEVKVYWSDDKNLVKIIYIMKDTSGTLDYTFSFVYDNKNKVSKLIFVSKTKVTDYITSKLTDMSSLYSISLKEDPAKKDLNGVFISFTSTGESSDSDTSFQSDGYADDNGGYLETKYTYKNKAVGTDPKDSLGTYSYKEGFDGKGNLKYVKYNDGSGWKDDATYNDTSYSDNYKDEFGEYGEYKKEINDDTYIDDLYEDVGNSLIVTFSGVVNDDDFYLIYSTQLTTGAIDYLSGINDDPSQSDIDLVSKNLIGSGFVSDIDNKKVTITPYGEMTAKTLYLYVYDYDTGEYKYAGSVNI